MPEAATPLPGTDLLDVDSVLAVQRERLDLSVIWAWLPAIEQAGGRSAADFEEHVRRISGQTP